MKDTSQGKSVKPACRKCPSKVKALFIKTGKLWWDPWMGGQGAIYSTIDGQGSAYPIVEVDNASRVIQYVGILGYRHSSYSLVDMRIHDINVVADLTRSNPNAPAPGEPEVYDGTDEGIVCETTDFDDTLKQAESQVFSWWDPNSWWPILHMKMWVTIAEIFNMIHFSVDLLQSIRLVDLVGAKQPDDAINNGMIDLTMTMSIIATLQVGLASLAAAESLWSSYFVPTAAWCFLAVGITALVGASIWAFSYAGQNLEAEYWTHANAYFFFFGLFLTMLWIFIGYKSLTGVFTSALMGIYLVSLGMAITGLLDIIRDFCKTLKFTRLVALLLMAIFGLVAAHHYVRYYGGN